MPNEDKEKPRIVIKGAEALNVKVTSASHTVEDETGKIIYESAHARKR